MKISVGTYPFNIGKFKCLVVKDYTDPEEAKMGLDQMCLLVQTPDHTILIDTGWGESPDPGVRPAAKNIEAAGISIADIDMVIHSHAHPDHIGGNTDARGRPFFPNARHLINKVEWEYWTSNPSFPVGLPEKIKKDTLNGLQKNMIGIRDRFQMVAVDGEREILPGIKLLSAPGHSPGMVVVLISSGTQRLLYLADVFHVLSEMAKPGWSVVSGKITAEARQTRVNMLSLALGTDFVFGCHFPFPGLGRIVKKGNRFLWQPVKEA